MKRTKKIRTPDAILTSDWHLREDQPICRTDDFWEAQTNKVQFIRALQTRYDCPVIHAGDLFHHWKPSPYLLSFAIANLPDADSEYGETPTFWTIYGQHDLPQHNLNLKYKSGVSTLEQAERLYVLEGEGVHYGQTPNKDSSVGYFDLVAKVLVWHILTWTGKNPWPGCTDPSAEELLDKYPEYDLIITGDNHKPFVVEKDGRLLVNPGSITRQTAGQVEDKPRIYLWYAEQNEVEAVYLPIEDNVISREHIEHKEQRDERIAAFISRLNQEWEADVSFEQNLKKFEQKNQVRKSVMDIIWEAIEK